MNILKTFLAIAAGAALIGCGEKNAKDGDADKRAAAQTEAGSPLDETFRLENATQIDVDALLGLIPGPVRPKYDSAQFDERLGATIVANLRFADAEDGEGVLIERAEFYGVDMDAVERVKETENGDPSAPFEKIFEKVRLLNVSAYGVDEAEGALSIAGVEIDKLSIRQGGFATLDEQENAAHFFNVFQLDGVFFKDLSLNSVSQNAPSAKVSAPDLRFVALGGGALGAVIAKNLEYEIRQSEASVSAMAQSMGPQGALIMNSVLRNFVAPENQLTKIKSFEWRKIDFSGLMEWGLKGEEPPVSERELLDLGTMKAVDLESFINGRRAALIRDASVSKASFIWLTPADIRADTKGAVYDFTAYVTGEDREALQVLKDHGLDNVEGDGYAQWLWNDRTGAGDLDYVANTAGLADLSMSVKLEGLKLDEIADAMDDGQGDAFAEHAALKSFNLKISDEQALDAIFALSALQMDSSAEDLRISAPAMIRLTGAQFALMNPKITGYINAVADFIAKGGTIEMSAAPADPLTISELQNGDLKPEQVPDRLNIRVVHTE